MNDFDKREFDFDKNRIAFTIALIASSFALYPILKDLKSMLPAILIHDPEFFKLKYAYLLFNGLLGGSIYFYALSFLGMGSNLIRAKKIGVILYKVAIMFPMVYFTMYAINCLCFYVEVKHLKFTKVTSAYYTSGDILFDIVSNGTVLILFCIYAYLWEDIKDNYIIIQERIRKVIKLRKGKKINMGRTKKNDKIGV